MNFRNLLKRSKLLTSIYPYYVKKKTKIRLWWMAKMTKPLTEDMLIEQLAYLGINPGDKVMIHSAGSKIGIIEGGPETFVRAIKRLITPRGLIVMPSFPHRSMYEYLENYSMFDVANTPSKNGAITECFRKSEGVFRSAHPTHPLCAWGKDAEDFVKGHEYCQTPFAEMSPFSKMLAMDIKLFLIGVNLEHVTMTRVIEDIYTDYQIEPYIPNKRYIVDVKLSDGEIVKVTTPCHDPKYFGKERNNMRFYPYLKDKITYGQLGHASTWIFSAQDLYKTQIDCVKQGIYGFNCYRYKNATN